MTLTTKIIIWNTACSSLRLKGPKKLLFFITSMFYFKKLRSVVVVTEGVTEQLKNLPWKMSLHQTVIAWKFANRRIITLNNLYWKIYSKECRSTNSLLLWIMHWWNFNAKMLKKIVKTEKSTEIHGNPQKSTEIHRNPRKSREIQRNPEKSREIQRNPRKSTEIHRNPIYRCETLWKMHQYLSKQISKCILV